MGDNRMTRAIAASRHRRAGRAAALWAGAPTAAALLALPPGSPLSRSCPSAPDPNRPVRPAPEVEEPSRGAPTDRGLRGNRCWSCATAACWSPNEAAKALLGAHIEVRYVRLAIRHPAAAEALAGEGAGAPVRIELVGLGELGRPWEMAVASLPDGSRLVRLADQSQARAAEQMRVDFVANASHELRTPLATLLGFIETLQDEEAVDAETRAALRRDHVRRGDTDARPARRSDSLSRIEADRFAPPRDTV